MAAEGGIIVVALCGGEEVAAQEFLPRSRMDSAAPKQQFPLPLIPWRIGKISRHIDKGQIVTPIQLVK